MTIIEVTPKRNPEQYPKSAWTERDNFSTQEQATAFGQSKARQYPMTPYRVVSRRRRWSLMYVPEWKLIGR